MDLKPKHRWYQYSLKALMAVMTLAAVLAWIGHERQKSYELQQAVAVLESSYVSLEYDEKAPRRPAWLRLVLGDNRPATVTEVFRPGSDAELALVSKFP